MSAANREAILFVYNVDLTLYALVSDFVHRLTAPETYPCRLCDLTYDRFTMKRDWKRFVASLPLPARFELRDRFRRKYPAYTATPLPAVFHVGVDDALSPLLTAAELQGVATIEQLRRLVAGAVAGLPAPAERVRRRARSRR